MRLLFPPVPFRILPPASRGKSGCSGRFARLFAAGHYILDHAAGQIAASPRGKRPSAAAGRATKRAALHLVDKQPTDWKNRSALNIAPGLWKMRNGHIAKIIGTLKLPYGVGKFFPVWKGVCVECNDPKTWNLNGTYAAVGKHANDIIGQK